MIEKTFQYDVAYSFAQKDEALALAIYKLLEPRLKSFIYSEEQKKLAGTDGEITFNKVFSEESRIVVIFYSSDWSNTKWTKIEETAIRNRGYEESYDFVILIPTEKNIPAPKWLPKNRLWIGLERWGIESAASVIEARVQEFGGQIKELTVIEKLVVANGKLKQKKGVEQILNSPEGVRISESEFLKLKNEFETTAKSINETLGDWHLKIIGNVNGGINLLSYNHSLTLQWYGDYAFITMTTGYINERLEKSDPFYDYKQILVDRKIFDINEFDQYGWVDQQTRKNFLSTPRLSEKYLNQFFDIVGKYRDKKNH